MPKNAITITSFKNAYSSSVSCCIVQNTGSREQTLLGPRARKTSGPSLRMWPAHRRRRGGLFAVGFWTNLGWPTKLSLRTSQSMPHSGHLRDPVVVDGPSSSSPAIVLVAFLFFSFPLLLPASSPPRWKQWFKWQHNHGG